MLVFVGSENIFFVTSDFFILPFFFGMEKICRVASLLNFDYPEPQAIVIFVLGEGRIFSQRLSLKKKKKKK